MYSVPTQYAAELAPDDQVEQERRSEGGRHPYHPRGRLPSDVYRASDDLPTRAVRRYQDRNVFIVAPGGNDRGASWGILAVLSDVLTVGAMRDNGQLLQCSNWGEPYQTPEGLAPG